MSIVFASRADSSVTGREDPSIVHPSKGFPRRTRGYECLLAKFKVRRGVNRTILCEPRRETEGPRES